MSIKNPLFLTGFVLLWTSLDYELAEGAGFEPANLSVNGFQDRRHRPLGHPSMYLLSLKLIVFYNLNPAHVRPEGIRDCHTAVGLLEILQDGNNGSAYGK